MKWETIKTKCIREACEQLKSPHYNTAILSVGAIMDSTFKKKYKSLSLTANLRAELIDEVEKVINNWDIRCYKTLQNVFPNSFPKKLYGVMDLGENGWELI
ncbi:unnamed protein product [marine sediment metagenome]|uniref:Uncharacterized protein n=1 Tax=marine sediment metagenome TaxID=412755 RepID=X0UFK3_9ZZZZ